MLFLQKEGTAPAKVLRDFQKENKDLLGLKIAYVDGSIFSAEDALKLADIPSREVLLSQLLGLPAGSYGKICWCSQWYTDQIGWYT